MQLAPLTPHQEEAFNRVITSDKNEILITGEAGVGKSMLFLHLINYMISTNQKIAVTGTSSLSVDNISKFGFKKTAMTLHGK